ncbi:MAG TPA: ADP-ribosylglycohydrolase family protein [Gemmatimonadales bacterium]
MARSALTLVDRARGAMLALAGAEALARDRTGWGSGEAALAGLLAEELAEPQVDLHRLAQRWLEWWRHDGEGLGPATADALAFLAAHDAPPPAAAAVPDPAPLARCLPLGLALANAPRNLVSGTYHTVMLTHPDPVVAWSAVAVNVAAARFARGRRDFVADVIEVLSANDAPPDLIATARRIPLMRRDDLRWSVMDPPDAVAAAELALWHADHEPVLERAVDRILGAAMAPLAAPLVAGLLGVRDGDAAVPAAWVARLADPDRRRQVAKRLVNRLAA